jgi:hypothetical protein
MEALPHGVRWKSTEIQVDQYKSTHPITLIYRDGLEVAKSTFSNPCFANHMMFDPHVVNMAGQQEFGEFFSAHYAAVLQVRTCSVVFHSSLIICLE